MYSLAPPPPCNAIECDDVFSETFDYYGWQQGNEFIDAMRRNATEIEAEIDRGMRLADQAVADVKSNPPNEYHLVLPSAWGRVEQAEKIVEAAYDHALATAQWFDVLAYAIQARDALARAAGRDQNDSGVQEYMEDTEALAQARLQAQQENGYIMELATYNLGRLLGLMDALDELEANADSEPDLLDVWSETHGLEQGDSTLSEIGRTLETVGGAVGDAARGAAAIVTGARKFALPIAAGVAALIGLGIARKITK